MGHDAFTGIIAIDTTGSGCFSQNDVMPASGLLVGLVHLRVVKGNGSDARLTLTMQ